MTDLEKGRCSLLFTSHKKANFQLCQRPKTKEIVVEDQCGFKVQKKKKHRRTDPTGHTTLTQH